MACLLLSPLTAYAQTHGTYTVQYSGAIVMCSTDSFGNPASCSVTLPDPRIKPPQPLTATFTWTPDPSNPQEPPPASAIVSQYCSASWNTSYANGSATFSGSVSNGLGAAVVPSANGATCQSTQYTVWSAPDPSHPAASFSVTCSPTASFTAASGSVSHSSVSGSAGVTYKAAAFPVTITLTGTTPDASGNPNILVGQGCTASLSGIPSDLLNNTAHPPTYAWSVSGNTFQSWNGASCTLPVAAVTGYGPATNPTAHWYWSDKASVKTVTCTMTLTPPTGQGAAFTVTAAQKVILDSPSYLPNEPIGVVQLNTSSPSFPGSQAVYAGKGANNTPIAGIVFDDTVTTPATPYTSTGYWYHVQIATESRYRTAVGSSSSVGSVNNGQGLDYTPLQGGGASYVYGVTTNADGSHASPKDDDNPSILVTNSYQEYKAKGESFQDYIMYSPPGTNSISVPLASFQWSWNADVKIPQTPLPKSWANWNNALTNGTITPPATVSRQTLFPVWSKLANPAW